MKQVNFNSGGGGFAGPFLNWTMEGSMGKGFPPQTFYLNDKDEQGNKTTEIVTPIMQQGVCMDFDNIATGWEQKDTGGPGVSPTRKWNQTGSTTYMERPGEDWVECFALPCVLNGGRSCTWMDKGMTSYSGVKTAYQNAVDQPGSQPGQLPVMRMQGVFPIQTKRGLYQAPQFVFVQWVPRPQGLQPVQPQHPLQEQAQTAPGPDQATTGQAPAAQPQPTTGQPQQQPAQTTTQPQQPAAQPATLEF